jgi:acyl-CoA thioester hydrolase
MAPPDRSVFEMPFAASAEDIDENGHVNNAVWVRWIQDVATSGS